MPHLSPCQLPMLGMVSPHSPLIPNGDTQYERASYSLQAALCGQKDPGPILVLAALLFK